MANQLKITSFYRNTEWVIESEVAGTSDPDFPRNIFLWTLARDGSLDKFQAIGHIDQVARYPDYDSDRTNNFGIRLVKNTSSRQEVATERERDDVIIVLKSAFDFLTTGYEEESIPTEELYPAQTRA